MYDCINEDQTSQSRDRERLREEERGTGGTLAGWHQAGTWSSAVGMRVWNEDDSSNQNTIRGSSSKAVCQLDVLDLT